MPLIPDLQCDIEIDTSLPAPPADAAPDAQTYTVVSGDSLSKIAKHFYGDASQYQRSPTPTASKT